MSSTSSTPVADIDGTAIEVGAVVEDDANPGSEWGVWAVSCFTHEEGDRGVVATVNLTWGNQRPFFADQVRVIRASA